MMNVHMYVVLGCQEERISRKISPNNCLKDEDTSYIFYSAADRQTLCQEQTQTFIWIYCGGTDYTGYTIYVRNTDLTLKWRVLS